MGQLASTSHWFAYISAYNYITLHLTHSLFAFLHLKRVKHQHKLMQHAVLHQNAYHAGNY